MKKLIARVEPGLVSEHLCWSSVDGRYLNDLLPLPYTEEALGLVCSHVEQAQDYLQRQILLENLSSYLEFTHSTMPEWTFLAAVAERTGCGILLDVNNIHVAATNHRFDPIRYLYAMPLDAVKEIHLAGFTIDHGCLIDTHSAPVAEPVWVLYRAAVARFGALPTLVEWDSELPAFDVLVGEALRAQAILEHHHAYAA